MAAFSKKNLIILFLFSILFSFDHSILQLVQKSHGLSSFLMVETVGKKPPFANRPDQVAFDYFASSPKVESSMTINEMINQTINRLIQGTNEREICGDGQDNDGNRLVDENCNLGLPSPPPPNDGQPNVAEQEICGNGQDNDGNRLVDENCPVEAPLDVTPSVNFNTSRTLRLAVVGDIDSNSGLTSQLNLANQYNVQALIIPGDYAYSSGSKVLSDFKSHGFTKDNTDIAVGNHDSGGEVKAWLNNNRTFGEVDFAFTGGRLALFNIDANTKFDCSSPQFEIVKFKIESSNARYKFAVVHQPFVTVKSTHSPNGQFGCYDPVFRLSGIDGVLQAHNHNYQRFDIDGLLYGVFGTGTHDTGSSMYPLKSEDWNGNTCIKCITGENGITIIDLQIDNKYSKHLDGWFINMDNKVLDHFL